MNSFLLVYNVFSFVFWKNPRPEKNVSRLSDLYIKSFDFVTLCDLVTVFEETKSVTKSRLHCSLGSRIPKANSSVKLNGQL